MPHRDRNRRGAYWRRTRRLTAILLTIWLFVTFAAIFYARELAGLTLFGWPVSYYLAAQGTLLVYLAIVGIYALVMRRLEKQYGDDSDGR